MKKLYYLDEQEKNRILNLHTEATKQQYLVNTKVLSEATIPSPRTLWKAINFVFKKGEVGKTLVGIGDELTDLVKNSPKTFNYKVIEALDDALANAAAQVKNWDDYLFRYTKDGKEVTYLMDSGYNKVDYDKIVKSIQTTFPSGINDNITDVKIEKLLESIPDDLISKNANNKTTLKLKTLWKAELDKLKKPSMFPGMPNLSSMMAQAPGLLFGTRKRVITTIGSVSYLFNAARINFIQSGSGSRKAISKAIETMIESGCSGITTTEFIEASGQKLVNNPGEVAKKILDAGFGYEYQVGGIDTGTDEDKIYNELIKLGNFTNFCLVKNAFEQNHQAGKGAREYMGRGYNYAIVNFFDYEFTGRLYDDVDNYEDYVKKPLITLTNSTKKELDRIATEQKSEEKKPADEKQVKSTSDGIKKPIPTSDSMLETLLLTHTAWGSDGFKCVVDEYKKFTGNKKIENKPNVSGIIIGEKAYGGDKQIYKIIPDGYEQTGKEWYCLNGKIVET